MPASRLVSWIALLACAVSAVSAVAEPVRRPLRVDDLFELREISGARISPDGEWVAYAVYRMDPALDRRDGDLWMIPARGGDAVRLTRDPEANDDSPRWSPDGRWLGFLSNRGGETTQVWLLDRRGGEPWRLTELPGGVSDFAWSPDGSRLVLVATDPELDVESDDAAPPKPIVIDRQQFKLDGYGFLDQRRDHLHLFDLRSKTAVQLTDGPYDDSEPVWSPDGRQVAFVSNRTADPDANLDSDVFVVDGVPGAEPRRISAAGPTDVSPAWSPDGRWLAWVEGGDPADLWYGSTHVSVAPVEGGSVRPLTAGLDRLIYAPRFAADGTGVFFLYEDRGNQPLGRVSLAGDVIEEIVFGERHVAEYDLGPRGEIVVLESSVHQPFELSRVEPDGLARLTHANDDWLAAVQLGAVERFTTLSQDGIEIQAFRILPPGHEPGAPIPAVLRLDGGPAAQFSTEFTFERQLIAADGYEVIMANPRGSSGRGRDFAHAIWADWGNKDYDDVMAAVDHEIAAGLADAERLGVFGWSYGGILTNYVLTKTDRFRAAISGASEVNYLSNYGHDHYQREWEVELGLPWRNPDLWLRLSPFFQVESVKTPTLVVCGQDDWNVPLVNSEQLYQALRRLGRTTELVIYPGESHTFERPSFVKDRYERYLAWFDRHIRGHEVVAPPAEPEAISLLGRPLFPPELDANSRVELEENLERAYAEFVAAPQAVDSAIWVARRLGYLGRYREALQVLTSALAHHPDDVRLLRHRGHRYLTVRELDNAAADLSRAAELIRDGNLPDEIEPDGAPNDLGVPVSTTHFNVYYHLGLAYYLKGDFEAALDAYRSCLETATGSNDRLVATTDWLWLTLMRLGRREEAGAALAAVPGDLEVIEDQVYLDRIRLYQGAIGAEDLLSRAGAVVDVATRTYGVAIWYLLHGQDEKAEELFERTLASPQWGAFAVIAAEAELARAR